MTEQAYQATPHKQLIAEIMDCRIPKTEREHAATREIEKLLTVVEAARERAKTGHTVTCPRNMANDFCCTCGQSALLIALAELKEEP